MKFFSKTFLKRHQIKLLFIIIWLHISVLDLFYITYRGPVFMWHENGQWLTLLVHFLIAILTTLLYWLLNKRTQVGRITKYKAKPESGIMSVHTTNKNK